MRILLADGTLVIAAATGETGQAETHSAVDPAATAQTTGHDSHGGKKTFPPLDPSTFAPQLIWFALTFGVLYYLLSRVALPRVTSVIEARAQHIQRDLDEAERLNSDTAKALADYEKALADAKGKANTIAQQTRDTLKTYVDQQRVKVDKEIADKTIAAEAQILASKQNAMANVGSIAGETAGAILARLLNQSVSGDEIAAAVRAVRPQ